VPMGCGSLRLHAVQKGEKAVTDLDGIEMVCCSLKCNMPAPQPVAAGRASAEHARGHPGHAGFDRDLRESFPEVGDGALVRSLHRSPFLVAAEQFTAIHIFHEINQLSVGWLS